MNFTIEQVHEVEDINNDNIDFRVILEDGRKFWGSFFTLQNIDYLMTKNSHKDGEWAEGQYFWSTNMVIVSQLTPEKMYAAIKDLLDRHLLDDALFELDIE